MQTKFFTKFISIFIIAQFIFAPTGVVLAELGMEGYFDASTGTSYGANGNLSVDGQSAGNIGTNVGGDTVLGQTVDTSSGDTASKLMGNYAGFQSLVGCKNADSRALGGTFGSLGSLFAKKAANSEAGKKATKKVNEVLGTKIGAGSDAVPTTNADLQKTADANLAKTTDIDKLATADNVRNNCLNGLAYRIAKYALAKLTKQTVNWINSGFNGDSFFIKDQYSYMHSLQNQQVNSILGPIGLYANRKNYPYGRDFARSYLEAQKSSYENNARSNLSSYFKKYMTPAQYSSNFIGGGGWNGWLGLTQNPANNPLGFGMMTSQQIADRAALETQRATNELNWGDGFLSQKKCVDPTDYTSKNAKKNPCNRWEVVTPGITINNQLNRVMGSPFSQLEMADQINESLSSVFDALVNQGMAWGISKLGKKDNSYETFGGPGSNRVYDSLGNDITNRNSKRYDSSGAEIPTPIPGGWFEAEKAFDITSTQETGNDLNTVIMTQKLYKQQLVKSVEPLPKIVPKLAELDYCIPGPHPGWENDVSEKIQEQEQNAEELLKAGAGNIQDFEQKDLPEWVQTINSLPVIGEVSSLISGIVSLVKDTEYRIIYGEPADGTRERLQAIKDAESELQDDLLQYASQTQPQITQRNFDEYEKAIDKYYVQSNIPVAKQARSMIANISSYKENVDDAISTYNDAIAETDSNIAQLEEIKKKVDAIVAPYKKDFTYCVAPYDPKLKDGLEIVKGGGTGIGSNTGPGGLSNTDVTNDSNLKTNYTMQNLSFESNIPMTDFAKLITMQSTYKDTNKDYVSISSGMGNTLVLAKTRATANGKVMLENKKRVKITATIKLLDSYSTKDNDGVYHYWGAFSTPK